jgi:streptomycin 6-kinase
MIPPLFQPWMRRWHLTPDGPAFETPFHSHLMPVRRAGDPAMLKIALNQEEREGAHLMAWYAGEGAVRILEHDGEALLMERTTGSRSLSQMARSGQDDRASTIICEAVSRLHAPRDRPRPRMLVSLPIWFRQLEPAAARHGGVLVKSAAAARVLLASSREERVLHGDIHHANILDGGDRGWLAIDPKGLFGERAFDYCNTFCNPDIETATARDRLARQAAIVARAAELEPGRLMTWILAYAGLSAAWTIDDGGDPQLALAVAQIAAAEMGA